MDTSDSVAEVVAMADTPAQAPAPAPPPPPLRDKLLSCISRIRMIGTREGRPTRKASSVPEPETESALGGLGTNRPQETERTESDSPSLCPSPCPSIPSPSSVTSACVLTDHFENGSPEFKVKDLGPFCEQLDRLLDYIHSTRELNQLIYSYPSKLQDLLDTQAQELHTLYMEAKAARLRIQQVKNQRKAVRKEHKTIEKFLSQIKDEEIKEMENYISLYDKTLMSRWEKINSSTQEDVVDSFIVDIKGKQKALEYLHTLATNKLSQLKNAATDEPKPVSLALRRLPGSGRARGSSGRWRSRHHERVVRAPSTSTSQDEHPLLPPVPLEAAPFNLTLGPAFTAGSSTMSSTSTFGSASSSLIPNNLLTIQTTQISSSTVTSPPTPNTPERRSVLQALFSDIQSQGTHHNLPINAVMPRLVTATSAAARVRGVGGTEPQNGNSSGSSQNGNEIELFQLNDLS